MKYWGIIHLSAKKCFSVRTGTLMQSSNLDYQTWAMGIYLCLTSLKGVSSMKLHRGLNITQKSAWHLAHRLRKAMEHCDSSFTEPVEVDETYVGGLRPNMSNAKRKELAPMGRGPSGKAAVVGVKDRDSKRGPRRSSTKHRRRHVTIFCC